MKGKSFLFLLISTVCILLFITGFLFIENKFYKKQNRMLLLQNDSIMSVNIEVKDSIDNIGRHVLNEKRKFKTISNK